MYNLYAVFPRQQICRDRQYSGLLRWAAYIGAIAVPDPITNAYIEQAIVAEKIPNSTDLYVNLTMSWTVADPGVQTNIREHLNAFNSEATEAAMDQQVDGALSAFMPKFCATQTSQADIDAWKAEHGYEPQTPPAAGRQSVPPGM